MLYSRLQATKLHKGVSKMTTIMSDINACLLLWRISWYDVFFWSLVSSNTSFSKVPLNILPCGLISLWQINNINQYLPSTPISFETAPDDDLWPNIIVIHFIVKIPSSFATNCSFRLASHLYDLPPPLFSVLMITEYSFNSES